MDGSTSCVQHQQTPKIFVGFSFFFSLTHSYLVMPFMGTDLGKLMKTERLSEDRVQYLVYQILKGLKVCVLYI